MAVAKLQTKLTAVPICKGYRVSKSTAAARKPRAKAGRLGANRAQPVRRIGGETSKTRSDLLDAAEELMRSEGYAAVTSRRVASQAKLTPQLVHYYFRTMDDLFLALWRRFVAKNIERHAQTLQSPEPLRALWNFSYNALDAVLETEFIALAHHRKAIRKEIAQDGDRFRQMQVDALARGFAYYGVANEGCSAEILTVLLTNMCRSLVMEKDLGMSSGHADTFRYIESWLEKLERRAAHARRTGAPTERPPSLAS